MKSLHLLQVTVLYLSAVSCGGGAPVPPGTVSFVIRLHGFSGSEEFRVATASADFIAKARAQLLLPEAQRSLFVNGAIAAGNAGVNPGWSWHFSDASLVEVAIELCDGRPSMVEANQDYWLNTVKRFCPWQSYVYAEAT